MAESLCARVRGARDTYTGYSVGSVAVWAAILAAARARRVDADTWRGLLLGCAAWWSGWMSATIARAAYPPPRELGPAARRRLTLVSAMLVALGLANAIRTLASGRHPGCGAPAGD